MKKTFTKEYIADNAGCYIKDKIAGLLKNAPLQITIVDILQSTIPVKDKAWFICRNCELNVQQLIDLSIYCAESSYNVVSYSVRTTIMKNVNLLKQYKELEEKRNTAFLATNGFHWPVYPAQSATYWSTYASNCAATAIIYNGEEKVLQYLIEFVNKID